MFRVGLVCFFCLGLAACFVWFGLVVLCCFVWLLCLASPFTCNEKHSPHMASLCLFFTSRSGSSDSIYNLYNHSHKPAHESTNKQQQTHSHHMSNTNTTTNLSKQSQTQPQTSHKHKTHNHKGTFTAYNHNTHSEVQYDIRASWRVMLDAGPNSCVPCLAAMQNKAITGLQLTSAVRPAYERRWRCPRHGCKDRIKVATATHTPAMLWPWTPVTI